MNRYSIVSIFKDPRGSTAVIVAYDMLTEKTEIYDIIDWDRTKDTKLTDEQYNTIIARLVEWRDKEREKFRRDWLQQRY